jgi:hypothetical protein
MEHIAILARIEAVMAADADDPALAGLSDR